MVRKKRTKTRDKCLALSKTETDAIGMQVYHHMKTDMRFITKKYIAQYQKACADVLGWDVDDLKQYISIALWKGIVTYDPTKRVNGKSIKLTTYLSSILLYQMINLSRKLQSPKHSSSKMYCPDELEELKELSDPNTSEDWMRYARAFKALKNQLSKLELRVLVYHLVGGVSISKMSKRLKVEQKDIIKALKNLSEKMAANIGD